MLHRPDHHASLHNGEFHDLIHLKLSLTGNGGGQADAEAVARTRQTDGGQGAHRQRHHPLREGELRPGGRGGAERRRARPAAEALPPAPRCLPRAARRSGVCPPQPPSHADQRLDQSPGSPMRQGPVRVLRGGLLLGKSRTNGPWRWTTSCPGTKAVPTTSATCKPSASAATPASATPIPPASAICRPATPCTRQAVCSACWSSSPGGWRGQRSKCDQILISNRSETAP